MKDEILNKLASSLTFFMLVRLTNTPDITSGHGWTLVNVGLTMAIAILEVKSVFYKKKYFL